MEFNFDFSIEDCIANRQAVLEFTRSVCPELKAVKNVVTSEHLIDDVVCDYAVMCYMQLMYIGWEELDFASRVLDGNGRKVICKESKLAFGNTERRWKRVKEAIPSRNDLFIWQYSTVDDVLYDRLKQLANQVYYPLLNEMLKGYDGRDTAVLQVLSHVVTGYIFTELAVGRGLIGAYKLPCPLLRGYSDSLMKLAEVVVAQRKDVVSLGLERLTELTDQMVNVVINMTNEMIKAIMQRASELDLSAYLAAADMTVEEVAVQKAKRNQSAMAIRMARAKAKVEGFKD